VAKPRRLKKPTALCFSRGAALATAYERVRAATGSLNKGDLSAADHYLFIAKLDLEKHGKSELISPSTSRRIVRAIEEPRLAIRKAMETRARGKIGRVSSTRVSRVLGVISEAEKRVKNQCFFGKVK
jgi:hypothetical protein